MEQGPGLMESVAEIGESLHQAPQLLVEVEPWHRVFFRNLADRSEERRVGSDWSSDVCSSDLGPGAYGIRSGDRGKPAPSAAVAGRSRTLASSLFPQPGG